MCQQCGDRTPGRRFQVDGTEHVLCGPCVTESRRIAQAHEELRRIHKAAHGFDTPCPTCSEDHWLQNQRMLEGLETSTMLANLGRAPLL